VRIFAVRHGETDFARERRFAGTREVPLTPRGRQQCEAVARALAGAPVAAVYASPLGRAQASAALIAAPHGLPVRTAEAFREMAFGAWEGLTRADVAVRFSDEFETWRAAPHRVQPPGGDSLGTVASRVAAAIGALCEAHEGESVVVVSHAIVTRLIVLAALGLGPDRLWSVDASPAGITEIEYQDNWVTVHRMNTLIHLDGLDVDDVADAPAPAGLGRAAP
jgi:broad specificity phosphatase PhoE